MTSSLIEETAELSQFESNIFAILTSNDEQGKMRGNRNNFIDIIQAGQEMGFTVYVLPVENLALTRKQLRGYVYHKSTKRWTQKWMPFPNIIYNRIPLRSDEETATVKTKLAACQNNSDLILFNPTFFNKWELNRWLRRSKVTKSYIPLTRKLGSASTLEELLQQHAYLYLKPESGKAGKGIMTIVKKDNNTLPYRLNIQEKTYSTTFNCSNFKKLWARIQQECGTVPYIVQQGIPLATFQNRKFDLRTLIQKNGSGDWEITGLGARIAGSTSITTHVPRGGSIDEPLKLLTHAFNTKEAHTIIEKASKVAIKIATQIERSANYRLGEMSMDIGVDESGGIWFFEANSKPMKFDEPDIRKKSLQRIFQYSQHLLKQ